MNAREQSSAESVPNVGRHALIIASDAGRARSLRESCRRNGLSAVVSSDPLHGMMQAARMIPAMILVAAEDDWSGSMSVAEVARRCAALSAVPVLIADASEGMSTVH